MDKNLVLSLLPVVNDPHTFKTIKEYAEYRVSYYKDALSSARDIEEVRSYQGAIKELKRLVSLQDEVRQKAEELRKNNG